MLPRSRRELLGDFVTGLQGVAIASLLPRIAPAANTRTHFEPKAKRVLQIFCPGEASHIGLWDYKPELHRRSGHPAPADIDAVTFQAKNGALMGPPRGFIPRGESGKTITELIPELCSLVDDIAIIHAMQSNTNTDGPACVPLNTGFVLEGFPPSVSCVS